MVSFFFSFATDHSWLMLFKIVLKPSTWPFYKWYSSSERRRNWFIYCYKRKRVFDIVKWSSKRFDSILNYYFWTIQAIRLRTVFMLIREIVEVQRLGEIKKACSCHYSTEVLHYLLTLKGMINHSYFKNNSEK